VIKMSQLVRDRFFASIIGISLLLFPLIAYSQDLAQFKISATEEGSYRTLLKKSGKVIWQASWSVMKTNKDGKEIVRITEQGSGKYNDSPQNINWVMETSLIPGNNPLILETIRIAHDPGNNEIWRRNKIFDYRNRKLIAEQLEYGKLKKRKTSHLPATVTFTSDVLAILLRGYNFETPTPFDFYIFSSEAKLFRIQAQVVGTEIVQVPAGEFECYKMELILDLGIANLVTKYILPKTYMWFTKKSPHYWVKFEGLESGIGSPHVVMELLKYSP